MTEQGPKDPFEGQTYLLRAVYGEEDVRETEINAGQLLDLAAGKPIVYIPHDKKLVVDEDGQTIERESAIPPDEAA
jgi:hypothetical protein